MKGAFLVFVAALALAACAQGEERPAPTESTSSGGTLSTTTVAVGVPEDGPDALLVLGDWGAETDQQQQVADAMEAVAGDLPVEAILTTGDNFYTNNVRKLMGPFDWAVGEIDFWIAWGNHDVEKKRRIDLVNQVFDNPPRWTVYRWGDYDVVILDSNQVTDRGQLAFLERVMENSERPTIVVFHHPALSCSSHGDTRVVKKKWVPRFDEDVVLVLSGHDHNYQRFEDNGVTYVVTGGGGRGLYGVKDCPEGHPPRVASAEQHHFLVMRQSEGRLIVTVINTVPEVIDLFAVEP
ncbi:MAG: metallophosphoesterase family protein [Acidimicrobiia bacterium]